MEYILRPDGSFQFAAPDRIADFASQNGLALFGHTLIWYEETPAAFERLDQSKIPFRQAFANYIEAVVGRYRGRAVGWDVVNEPIAEDGNGLRESLWSARLGDIGYMELAFELARRADPQPVLFLNDYNLESNPAKRAAFLNLAERLLAAGAPLGGLGTQTHVAADLRRGAITACVADLGSLGLQVRISEMDVSLSEAKALFTGRSGLLSAQARLYAEAAEAMMALPAAQRFGVTFWGLRDRDSWLRREHPGDSPLLFDDQGRPKPDLAAFESRLTPRRKG
ncbi:MAG: endo-1,4-beta-xylanase, partial [Caulobacteraceae bacterium]